MVVVLYNLGDQLEVSVLFPRTKVIFEENWHWVLKMVWISVLFPRTKVIFEENWYWILNMIFKPYACENNIDNHKLTTENK